MHSAVIAEIGFLSDDVKAEGALVYISALHSLVKVHGIRIVRIDRDASPQAVRIRAQFQRPRFVPSKHKPCVMVTKCLYITTERLVKRFGSNRFSAAGIDFIVAVEYCEISLNVHSVIVRTCFKRRGG